MLDENARFDASVSVLIVGAGACGLCAALTAADAGIDVMVLERDSMPTGSTSLSGGLIPAAGSKLQARAGITDSPERLVADIMLRTQGQTDEAIATAVARESGPLVDWLVDVVGLEMKIRDMPYAGHSTFRLHGPLSGLGADLEGALLRACTERAIDIVTDARVTDLVHRLDGRVTGVAVQRPGGTVERIGCAALVLACSGFGGNPNMVARHIPEMAGATYFGHVGNQGDAVTWGASLGAALADMSSYQGHGTVAFPHGILLVPDLPDGGFQVNVHGQRFSNEARGYSTQASDVAAQPDHIAWLVYDEEGHAYGLAKHRSYRECEELGAIKKARFVEDLARVMRVPPDTLRQTFEEVGDSIARKAVDRFGRDMSEVRLLRPPFCAVRVSGYLFHTQGGLVVDETARVMRPDGSPLPNLLAGGGAARGLSGPSSWGYLSGGGLLAATTLGRIAGRTATHIATNRLAV